MAIFTTYLGFLNKHGGADKVAQKLGSCFIYYVMRNRGNNEVAPSKALLSHTKRLLKRASNKLESVIDEKTVWYGYAADYQQELDSNEALKWMKKRAQDAKIGNILLVCFEKDQAHCHRRLLPKKSQDALT